MDPKTHCVTAGAALLLAVAAVLSTPPQASGQFEDPSWPQLGAGAAAVAGAIAEHPENFVAP